MAELRGLGEASAALEKMGGRLLAVSVDPPAIARRVVEDNRLGFAVLCDTNREVVRAYGLLHEGGGPGGSDIAVPAHILIDTDGRVVSRFVSRRIQDRRHPHDALESLRQLAR
jgi:peroxiredoxin